MIIDIGTVQLTGETVTIRVVTAHTGGEVEAAVVRISDRTGSVTLTQYIGNGATRKATRDATRAIEMLSDLA